jgi:hypothetical protein
MSSPASEPSQRRHWVWWIPDYPERLGPRDIGQIASTVLLTVVFAIGAISTWGSGGVTPWLFALAAVLGAVGLVGLGLGLRRPRRRAGS